MWRRHGEAASAAALYSVYSGLYSEAVVSSMASAVALAEVGQFREAVQYVQRAAKALYEAAKEVFERVKITVQRLVELFVEAVARALAWIDEHKAYLFLMAAVTAGAIALSAALNLWGLVELEKLAYAAVGAPFFVGLAETGGKAAERFKTLAERWRVDENKKQKIEGIIKEIINAPLRGGTSQSRRPYEALLKLAESANLPRPLAELRRALKDVKDEVEKDAAVVAALVLYKTLINNAGAYREWAELYKRARSLVEKQAFTVATGEIGKIRETQRRLEGVAGKVLEELNAVLAPYALHSRDLYEKLRPHLEVDVEKAEELAEARHGELSNYSDVNIGTKAYAALLSIARGGIYGHAAMLLMAEGALADVVLSTPEGVYLKAWEIAKGRGEAVDPSRSRVGAVDWEDRAASTLLRFLIGYGETDLKFRHVEKRDKKGRVVRGFQVFKVYGGVEAFVGELWIEDVARFNVSKEERRRFVEEAKRTAPDLTGIKKIWQALEWLNTDVSFAGRRIEAATAHLWQAAWYIGLFGEPKPIRGGANVTEEGINPIVKTRWPRERLDRIIAEEGEELKPLLGRTVSKQGGGSREAEGPAVRSWRGLVDAIDWSWVVKRVEELAGALKPWIGPEEMSDAEREGHARRMLGELTLLAHFVETRRGLNDREWREERVKRLARAVEALSGGKIRDEYADRLARLIIRYAERREERAKKRIENLAEEVGISRGEMWGVVKFVLSDMYCLARDCTDDRIVRKFVAPALELIMLDKALNNKFDREKALRIFGEMYTTALAGDGTVGPRRVELTVGGELGGGAALLRLAALLLLSQLLPKELKFGMRAYVGEGRYYRIAAYGEDAAKLMRLLAVSAPSAGGGYLSPKFEEFMKEARVEVRVNNIRQTDKDRVAADLIISEGGVAVKYNVYLLKNAVELHFASTDRSRVELAARLLRLVGVSAEVKRKSDEDVWYVVVTTDKLAAGREELRKALAKVVEAARSNDGVDEKKAKRWLEKLEKGRVLMEGWPKYYVGLVRSGALVVRYRSSDPDSIEQEAQRLEKMGLKRGVHFTVEMPEGGKAGYVYIRREGLAYAAWLSVRGKDEQQRRMAADFVELILRRAEEVDKKVKGVYEKVNKIIEEGMSWSSLELNFEKWVEVNGKTYFVKVISGEAVEEKQNGKLRIKIKVEVGRVEGGHIVDPVESEYMTTFGRYGRNAVLGFATARADAPGGREADAERFAAVIEALTGVKPRIRRRSDGRIELVCGREHLEGFKRFAELADVIERWLEETGR